MKWLQELMACTEACGKGDRVSSEVDGKQLRTGEEGYIV